VYCTSQIICSCSDLAMLHSSEMIIYEQDWLWITSQRSSAYYSLTPAPVARDALLGAVLDRLIHG
jgi:hypothetical protein